MGHSIKSLINNNQPSGYQSIKWNAKNNQDENVHLYDTGWRFQAGKNNGAA